jgi:hypothetical protein
VSRVLNDNANVLLLRVKRGLRVVVGAVRQRGKLSGQRDDVVWLLQVRGDLDAEQPVVCAIQIRFR